MTSEPPVATLERWVDSGADYRVVHLSDEAAIVELLTCDGQPVELLEARDESLVAWLRSRAST